MKQNKKVMSDMVGARPKKARAVEQASPEASLGLKQAPTINRVHTKSPVRETPVRQALAVEEESSLRRKLSPPPLFPNKDQETEPQKMGCALWILLPVCLVMITLGIGGLVSGASVAITPKSWSGTVDITTSFSLGGTNSLSDTPSFYTATKTFTEEVSVPAVETTTVESFASGTVRFYNVTAQSITIPAKTEVTLARLTGGTTAPKISYITEKAITLPKGTKDKPSQKDVVIKATKSGTLFNTQPTDFTLVKPVAGVTIRGVTSIDGGADPTDRSVSPEVLASTKAQLLTRFDSVDVLVGRVVEDIPGDMIALPLSFTTSEPEVQLRPSNGSSATVVAEKTVTAVLVKRSELARLLGKRLGVPEGLGVTIVDLHGLTIVTSALGSAENIPKVLPVRITGEVSVIGAIADDQIRSKIVGKSKREARSLIADYPEVGAVTIHTVPFWRRILPLDANKISVTVLNP